MSQTDPQIPAEFETRILTHWQAFLAAKSDWDNTQSIADLSAYTRGFKALRLINLVPYEDRDAMTTFLIYVEVQKDGSQGR